MSRADIHSHMARLEVLTSMLKSDDFLTAGSLAGELGISLRTLHRDLNILRERGLPIDADRGRGGGIRLHRTWGTGRLQLSDPEAVDLLISLAIADKMNSPLFMASLKTVRRKLMALFPANQKYKIDTLRERILIGGSASPFILSSFDLPSAPAIRELNRAFLFKQSLEIKYQDGEGQLTRRRIEPHYLYLNYPVWYVLAYDDLRSDYRTFRCDRLVQAEVSESNFKLLSFDRFRHMVEPDDVMLV